GHGVQGVANPVDRRERRKDFVTRGSRRIRLGRRRRTLRVTARHVRVVVEDRRAVISGISVSGLPVEGRMGASEVVEQQGLAAGVDETIARASRALLSVQCPGGYWQGLVEAAANLEAEYVFANRLLGRQRPEQDRRMVERLLALQQDDGGWALAPGQPGHLSTSIEAYLALKLAGLGNGEPALARARELILSRGGLAASGMFTRFWLACFGQFPWAAVPRVPVE